METGTTKINGKIACAKCKTTTLSVIPKTPYKLSNGQYIHEWACCKCGNTITISGTEGEWTTP